MRALQLATMRIAIMAWGGVCRWNTWAQRHNQTAPLLPPMDGTEMSI